MPETLSHSFSVGDYFEVVEGMWKGTKGKTERISKDAGVFWYTDCKTGKYLMMFLYVFEKEGMAKKIKKCD